MRSPSTRGSNCSASRRHDVEVAVEHDRRALREPDARRQHRQAADLQLLDRDVARLEPPLDEAGSLADALVVGGVVADQSLGEGSLVHAQSGSPARETPRLRRAPLARSRQTEARVYRRDPAVPRRGRPPCAGARGCAAARPARPSGGTGRRPTSPRVQRQRGPHLARRPRRPAASPAGHAGSSRARRPRRTRRRMSPGSARRIG